jgi:hypothetical protein
VKEVERLGTAGGPRQTLLSLVRELQDASGVTVSFPRARTARELKRVLKGIDLQDTVEVVFLISPYSRSEKLFGRELGRAAIVASANGRGQVLCAKVRRDEPYICAD